MRLGREVSAFLGFYLFLGGALNRAPSLWGISFAQAGYAVAKDAVAKDSVAKDSVAKDSVAKDSVAKEGAEDEAQTGDAAILSSLSRVVLLRATDEFEEGSLAWTAMELRMIAEFQSLGLEVVEQESKATSLVSSEGELERALESCDCIAVVAARRSFGQSGVVQLQLRTREKKSPSILRVIPIDEANDALARSKGALIAAELVYESSIEQREPALSAARGAKRAAALEAEASDISKTRKAEPEKKAEAAVEVFVGAAGHYMVESSRGYWGGGGELGIRIKQWVVSINASYLEHQTSTLSIRLVPIGITGAYRFPLSEEAYLQPSVGLSWTPMAVQSVGAWTTESQFSTMMLEGLITAGISIPYGFELAFQTGIITLRPVPVGVQEGEEVITIAEVGWIESVKLLWYFP